MQHEVEKWKYPSNRYHVAQVWKEIRIKKARVNWHKLIWTPFVMPKHALIALITIINRLPTKNRLKSRGLEIDGPCVLCKQNKETKDHLFFGCNFSQ